MANVIECESMMSSDKNALSNSNVQAFKQICDTNGAFPLHDTVRFGTACYGTVRLSSGRFAFPLQFSTALQWAGLFMCHYSCAASTAVTSS